MKPYTKLLLVGLLLLSVLKGEDMAFRDDLANSLRNTAGKAVYYGERAKLPEFKVSEGLNWLGNLIAPKAMAMEFPVPETNTRLPGQIFPVANPIYGPTYNGPQNPSPTPSGTSGGNGGGGQVLGDNTGGGSFDVLEALRRERESALGTLRNRYNEGMSYVNNARQALGKKRDSFKGLFDEGRQSILNETEKGRGELSSANEGADARLYNRMLAQGRIGSQSDEALRRSEMGRQKALGGLLEDRRSNERENQRQLDSRNDWADAQERELSVQEMALQNRLGEGERSTIDNFQGILGSLLTNIQSNLAALKASQGGIDAYKTSPFVAFGFDPNLGANLAGELGANGLITGGNKDEANQNISVNNDPTILAELRRKGLLNQR